MQKILKKFMKTHFETKDNVIDKKVRRQIELKGFNDKTVICSLIEDIKDFFDKEFTGGNTRKTVRILEHHNN